MGVRKFAQIAQFGLARRTDRGVALDDLARDVVGRAVDDLLDQLVRRMIVELAAERLPDLVHRNRAIRRASRSRAAFLRLITCCRVTRSRSAIAASIRGRRLHNASNSASRTSSAAAISRAETIVSLINSRSTDSPAASRALSRSEE